MSTSADTEQAALAARLCQPPTGQRPAAAALPHLPLQRRAALGGVISKYHQAA